ncbi:MAG: hypothetical protein K2O42_10480 [Oscillospiraceae bacterium]|nr:hypothetical protein [Oscillospiraceae bacterium]
MTDIEVKAHHIAAAFIAFNRMIELQKEKEKHTDLTKFLKEAEDIFLFMDKYDEAYTKILLRLKEEESLN